MNELKLDSKIAQVVQSQNKLINSSSELLEKLKHLGFSKHLTAAGTFQVYTAPVAVSVSELASKSETEISKQLQKANAELLSKKEALDKLLKLESTKIWKEKTASVTAQKDLEKALLIVNKLTQAKTLVDSMSQNEDLRIQEMVKLHQKIADLATEAREKDREYKGLDLVTEQITSKHLEDQKKYEQKIKKIKQDMDCLFAKIEENNRLYEHCQRMAEQYDTISPDKFPDHWIEVANVLLERQDAYGFQGVINHRDLDTNKTPDTCLEMCSVAYGAILKKDEVVIYTMPKTPIKIEHDACSGKISDRTPYDHNTSEEQKNLAALKCAKLILLDCLRRKDRHMYLQGPGQFLDQSQRVVAALHAIIAELGAPKLDRQDIEVKVVGWRDGDEKKYESRMRSLITSTPNATSEFKKLHEKMRRGSHPVEVVVNEEIINPKP